MALQAPTLYLKARSKPLSGTSPPLFRVVSGEVPCLEWKVIGLWSWPQQLRS